MHILNFQTFLIAITILTLTPGIDTALIIKNSSRSGSKDGYITSLGICCGLFVHATLSAIGISAILLQSAQLFQVIKWLGALYLIWLGINGIKATLKGVKGLTVVTSNSDFSCRRSLREGFLSNLLNPKTALFYLAFLPQFINPEYSPFVQSIYMAAIHFLIAMLWQCALAALVNSAKRILQNAAFMNWMEGITGTVLIVLAAKLITE